jgi:hypothetical protein
MPEAEQLLAKLGYSEKPYDSSSYKNYYDLAVKQIAPKPTKHTSPASKRELDLYVTLGTAILGRRSTDTASGARD